jgi:hypothetical protein
MSWIPRELSNSHFERIGKKFEDDDFLFYELFHEPQEKKTAWKNQDNN